jgi:hypothetical protein
MDHPAIYYPSRISLMKAKAADGGQRLIFSNDFGAACHEQRHMIDAAALEELEGGSDLLASVVEPVPACRSCGIIKMEQQEVVGMLKDPLVIKYHIKLEGPNKGKRVEMSLDQVLVIRQLPVPLHISFNRLRDTINRNGEWFGDLINIGFNESTRIPFEAANVPERYRVHPFWNEGKDEHFLGLSGNMNRLNMDLRAADSSKDTAGLVTCTLCGKCPQGVKLKLCGRCKKARYCCKDHQTQHWSLHKKTCVAPSSTS